MAKTEIFENFESFLNRPDKSVNGVSPEFAKGNSNYAKQNKTNTGCWDCEKCNDCEYCTYCLNCKRCDYCVSCNNRKDCYELSFC